MEHKANVRARLPTGRRVADVAVSEVDPIAAVREVLLAPGREVVENPDLGADAEELVHEVRADEPGAAGHQDPAALDGVSSHESVDDITVGHDV